MVDWLAVVCTFGALIIVEFLTIFQVSVAPTLRNIWQYCLILVHDRQSDVLYDRRSNFHRRCCPGHGQLEGTLFRRRQRSRCLWRHRAYYYYDYTLITNLVTHSTSVWKNRPVRLLNQSIPIAKSCRGRVVDTGCNNWQGWVEHRIVFNIVLSMYLPIYLISSAAERRGTRLFKYQHLYFVSDFYCPVFILSLVSTTNVTVS